MAGADHRHPLVLEVEQRVGERGHLVVAEREREPVEPVDDARRRVPVERVGAQPGAHLGHHRRRADAVAHDVADDQRDALAAEAERVVPVAADPAAPHRGPVAGGEHEPGDARQRVGHEAALEHLDDAALMERPRALDRRRGAVGGELEQLGVGVGEFARRERADVQHADHGALDEQRDAEQRADAALAQDRVEDVGVVDVGDVIGRRSAAIRPANPRAERNPHALLDLLLDALGGGRDQLAPVLVEQQERGRVGVEDLGDALEQLLQQLVERQVGERRRR